MTVEEQIKEQERIFDQANKFLELEKQQNVFQPVSASEVEIEQIPTAIELMRDQIMNIDFEAPDEDSEVLFTFDE